MKTALFSSFLALFMVPFISGCNTENAVIKMTPVDLCLTGQWYAEQSEEDGSIMWLDISDDSVEVYLSFDEHDFLCWDGTYTKPKGRPDRYLWLSVNNQLTTRTAVYERQTTTLFEYYDGEIKVSFGINQIIFRR